jgi:hypothetical protein
MKELILSLFGWIGSVRSLVTLGVVLTFCLLAIKGRIDPKDFMLIVSLVCNFYFMNKQRTTTEEKK